MGKLAHLSLEQYAEARKLAKEMSKKGQLLKALDKYMAGQAKK